MSCSPQRYLANNRNLLRDAILAASSVLPVADQVVEQPVGRVGTAAAVLSGSYTGAEEATFDVRISDNDVDESRISAPVASGEGSGQLTGIASTLSPQRITVQLADSGIPVTSAAVAFEGVRIFAHTPGAGGNAIYITVDQAGLTFDTTPYSLLEPLKTGSGSASNPMSGPAYHWDSATLGADGIIPASAHRVAFGDDRSAVYLQFREFKDNDWQYRLVPELQRDIPAGTPVMFVTGGRVVEITDGVDTETYPGIITDYDLLNALRTTSALVEVDGVVANDRTPTGQASREMLVRTDAHVQPSTGSGSSAAMGFENAFALGAAATELITAKAYAVNTGDDQDAHLGAELWKVAGSLSGDLGNAVTGVPFLTPDGLVGFTIPQRLPANFGEPKGKFTFKFNYKGRANDADPPLICPKNLRLGVAASDQTLTLTWTKRPVANCPCDDMPLDAISAQCLGIDQTSEGGADVSYSSTALAKLASLYSLASDITAAMMLYVEGVAFQGIPTTSKNYADGTTVSASETPPVTGGVTVVLAGDSDGSEKWPVEGDPVGATFADQNALPADFLALIDEYEAAVAAIDAVNETGLKADGFTQWDVALGLLTDDLNNVATGGTLPARLVSLARLKYTIALRGAMLAAGVSSLGKGDASADALEGDGCWRDWGDGFYWKVEGSTGGDYAPAFNNHIYYSSKLSESGKYNSTREFAFQINVKCPERLLVGDQIVFSMNGTGYGATYQIGDVLTLPVIAAAPLYLAGGQDGIKLLTFSLVGDVTGPLPSYVYDPDSPAPYTTGSPSTLSFLYEPGGIPNQNGDRWTFATEGGHYQYRKNGGAWSGDLPITNGAGSIGDGLMLTFVAGAAPSFVEGDTFSFRALQPWAVSNLVSPGVERWQWAVSSPDQVVLDIDLGTAQAFDIVALAFHTIPLGATILLEAGSTTSVLDYSQVVLNARTHTVQPLPATWTARYVRLTVSDAGEAGIGWMWLGEGLLTSQSADVQLSDAFRISRPSGGAVQGGKFLGRTVNASVNWQEGSLSEADAENLSDMLGWVKENDDEQLIVIPTIGRPRQFVVGRVVQDEINIVDLHDYNQPENIARRYSTRFDVQGQWVAV